ncbi:unnamed protein product, partial [Onchocerca flexuosa]|uniref:Protein kinase domain-containing protein n=1 Tax=Onchocerca flexuosa TaxID=387005 RepID=A0A183HC05_9BILA
NSQVLPSRGEIGWRGTTRYGSLNAHYRQDLARRDDLESWFYMTVEFTKGSLPWRSINDRLQVQTAKEDARTTTKEIFFENCPSQYDQILQIIDKLKFHETPPYATFYNIFTEVFVHLFHLLFSFLFNDNGIVISTRYDWDDSMSSISTSPSVATLERSPAEVHHAGNMGHDRPTRNDLPVQ